MKYNEHDAARQLCDTAELKMQGTVDDRDPLEQTQRMPVAERRYRQFEAKVQRTGVAMQLEATGRFRTPPPGFAVLRSPDFREGYRRDTHPLHVAQQDGFPNDKQ